MKRLLFAATAVAALSASQIAAAQAPAPIGNNPTSPGIYLGLGIGVSLLDDTDFDVDGVALTAEADPGFYSDVVLGYTLPQGPFSFRGEAELAVRTHGVDELEGLDALDNSDISSFSGMANAHVDYYILPNTAISAGIGLGYATVQVDIAVDNGINDVAIFDEETDSGFAYQGMLGARYDFAGGSTIEFGYTYFAVDDLAVENANTNIDEDFDYLTHSFQIGYSYRF